MSKGQEEEPPLDEKRLAWIRMFLVEMYKGTRPEGAGEAAIVYLDETFVHQAHASVYSHSLPIRTGRLTLLPVVQQAKDNA